jgi:hypothetical protein
MASSFASAPGSLLTNFVSAKTKLTATVVHASEIADALDDGTTAYLIERALDEARSRLVTPAPREPR